MTTIAHRVVQRLRNAWGWRWQRLRTATPHRSRVYAHARCLVSRHPLPPGDGATLTPVDRTDRARLLRRVEIWGPVFRGTFVGEFCICVADLALGRRLLQEHAPHLKAMSIDIRAVVPEGFLRNMQGEVHRHYRKSLVRAVVSADLMQAMPLLHAAVERRLAIFAQRTDDDAASVKAFHELCHGVAEELLLLLFASAPAGSPVFERLSPMLAELRTGHNIWKSDSRQAAHVRTIMRSLQEVAAALAADGKSTILSRLSAAQSLDDVILANVSYMLMTGAGDLATFFSWLIRYAAADPDTWESLIREADEALRWERSGAMSERFPVAHALVLEVLRHTQSDRLMRRATADFAFHGFLIPRGSIVRVAMWEAHHDPRHFEEASEFRSRRFLDAPPSAATFSPFGLDQHLCPFANATIEFGTLLVASLAQRMQVRLINDGPGRVDEHHWELPADFSVALSARGQT